MLVDEEQDQPYPRRAAQRVARRRRAVAVERGQAARGERGVDLSDRRRDDVAERLRGRVLRDLRQPTREQPREPVARQQRQQERRYRDHGERSRVRAELALEGAGGSSAGERRQHRDAHRGPDEHEHEEDRVGGKEAVGLGPAAELPCDHDADDRGKTRDDGERDRREGAACERAPARWVGTLHRPRELTPASRNHGIRLDLARERRRRAPSGVRRRLRGPDDARHGRGRLHGLAPHGRARRARRRRARVRPRHVERGAEQHRSSPGTDEGALRRPHRQDARSTTSSRSSATPPRIGRTSSIWALRRTWASRGTGPTRR